MATSAKAVKVNYSDELTASIKAMYEAGDSVESIAAFAGKTTRSIVAKLSREGVYKAKAYVAKNGEKPIAKEALVEAIAEKLGVPSDKLNGLEKTNKEALKLILASFA